MDKYEQRKEDYRAFAKETKILTSIFAGLAFVGTNLAVHFAVPEAGIIPAFIGGLGTALFASGCMAYYYSDQMQNWDLQCGRVYLKEERRRRRELARAEKKNAKNAEMGAELGR